MLERKVLLLTGFRSHDWGRSVNGAQVSQIAIMYSFN